MLNRFKKILRDVELIRKLVIVLIVLSMVILAGVMVWRDPAFKVQVNTIRYSNSPSVAGLHSLVGSINKLLEKYHGETSDDLATLLNIYNQQRTEIDSRTIFYLPEIQIANEEITETSTDFQEEAYQDQNFFQGEKYIHSYGQLRKESTRNISINISGNVVAPQAFGTTTTQELKNKVNAEGTRPHAEIQSTVQENTVKLIGFLRAKDNSSFINLVSQAEPAIEVLSQKPSYQYIVDRLEYKSFELKIEQAEGNATEIPVANVFLTQTGCATNLWLKLIYLPESGNYVFTGMDGVLATGCKPAPVTGSGYVPGPAVTLSCSDCWLAPVDKTRRLRADYVPAGLTGLNVLGGGLLTANAAQAAASLFQGAANAGIQMQVVSSYRSYATQQVTFENWVQTEMAQGYDRATAEVRANVYSARPGHSEHQLGTVMDLSCYGCAAFDNSAGNLAVYNFLAANAHKYGFVISYPPNTQHLTGYKYEPWHVRFVGIDLATQFFNTGYTSGNGRYIAEFLTGL